MKEASVLHWLRSIKTLFHRKFRIKLKHSVRRSTMVTYRFMPEN